MLRAVTVAAIIQARMSSARFPGKVLRDLEGKPVLAHVVSRLRRSRELDGVFVATSTDSEDDPVAAWCVSAEVPCHRGSLDDVAARFAQVVSGEGLDAFVRISGDSPLIDPDLVDDFVRRLRSRRLDVVTNVFPRSFPPGQSVEVVAGDAYARALALMEGPDDREHVTPVLYRRAETFEIENVTLDPPRRDVHLAIDDADDLARCERLLQAGAGDKSVRELIALYDGCDAS